jgi:hypothetical protein
LAVVPPKTETVVFSIDGSFTASMSVTGKDPKVRAGAVDVVRFEFKFLTFFTVFLQNFVKRLMKIFQFRYWQELGYLIIYITGRPDMQQVCNKII